MLRWICMLACAASALAQNGAAVYKDHCASCHDTPTGRVPTFSALREMKPAAVMQSLETGAMKMQAAGLTTAERYALVTFLATPDSKPEISLPQTAFCSTSTTPPTYIKSGWNGWGANPANTRFQNETDAGIAAADVAKLRLKWAFSLGSGATVRSQPALQSGRLYAASLTGEVYSLNARTGCIDWAFRAEGNVRTAIVAGNGSAVYFGDDKANTYAVEASTGKSLWKTHVGDHFASVLTGAPLLHSGVLYVPVSSYEEALAASPGYECCTFRGEVVALDAATGNCLWKTFTVPEEKPTADPKAKTHGPSGAAVWSTPTFDDKLNALYIATGDNYSEPASNTSDAVLALDAKTGKLIWSKQVTPNDVYNLGAHSQGHDFDFGQPPILVSLANGKRALVIGQKSGIAYGLDPDRNGELLWQTRLGNGGPLGGIQWGSASDGEKFYVALSDLAMTPVADKAARGGFRLQLDASNGGGLFALDLANGQKLWSAPPVACGGRKNCSPAQSAAVTAIPGLVFSGSVDGHLRAYSASSGEIIWDFDTAREYDTVNGSKAKGGSIDVAGPVIAAGMLYINSGYAQWGGMAGNVLLAFSVDGK